LTDPTEYSETAMLLQVAAGDELAFRQLFDRYRAKLFTYILKITASKEAAEDAVHDVFLKIWQHRAKLHTIDNLNAYIFRMAHNHACNVLKRAAKEVLVMAELEKADPLNHENPAQSLARKEIRQFIHEAVNRLTPQQKQVFLLSRENGLKQEEIAAQLNISILTVKKHLTNALSQLRQDIDRSYGSAAVAVFVLFSLVP
jgi:RNA polymerase sigma-70 factor (family 1)